MHPATATNILPRRTTRFGCVRRPSHPAVCGKDTSHGSSGRRGLAAGKRKRLGCCRHEPSESASNGEITSPPPQGPASASSYRLDLMECDSEFQPDAYRHRKSTDWRRGPRGRLAVQATEAARPCHDLSRPLDFPCAWAGVPKPFNHPVRNAAVTVQSRWTHRLASSTACDACLHSFCRHKSMTHWV
jgi:hypothetical protein